jgi:hypothetical protein
LELVRATFHSILRRRAHSETRSSTATDFQQCPVLWRCIHRQPKWRTGYSARDELVSSFSICKLFECKPTKLVSLPSNVTIRSNKTRCCPANYVCASPANSNGLIGCCPSGNTCGGTVNVAQVTTVTVYPQQQTAVVYANPPPQTTVVVNNHPNQAQGGFCATITMSGPDLPRAAQGNCGTILLVAGASGLKAFGIGATLVTITLHLALGRMFNRI